jgi:hypothetical protein
MVLADHFPRNLQPLLKPTWTRPNSGYHRPVKKTCRQPSELSAVGTGEFIVALDPDPDPGAAGIVDGGQPFHRHRPVRQSDDDDPPDGRRTPGCPEPDQQPIAMAQGRDHGRAVDLDDL